MNVYVCVRVHACECVCVLKVCEGRCTRFVSVRYQRESVDEEESFTLAFCFRCFNLSLAGSIALSQWGGRLSRWVKGTSGAGHLRVGREQKGKKDLGNRYNLQRHVPVTYYF